MQQTDNGLNTADAGYRTGAGLSRGVGLESLPASQGRMALVSVGLAIAAAALTVVVLVATAGSRG